MEYENLSRDVNGLLTYLEATHCTGHTYAAMHGLNNSDRRPILVCTSGSIANIMTKVYNLPSHQAKGIPEIAKMAQTSSQRRPLVFDSEAVETILYWFRLTLEENEKLKMEVGDKHTP